MTIATERVVAIALVLSIATPASAQIAEAEALFRDGRRLLKEGRIAEACEKLEASDRLDPTVGSALNLADCREKNGQLATAWAVFRKAADLAKRHGGDDEREAEARRRAAALEPRLPHLRIEVGHEVAGLVIKRNEVAVDPALWNQSVPVDAGTYLIHAEAPGRQPWDTSVVIAGADETVALPDLPSAPAVTGHADAPHTPASSRPRHDDVSMTGERKVALALGAAGVVAGGIGVGFAFRARDLEHQSNQLCPSTMCADARGVQLNHDARLAGTVATVGFVTGAVAAAGAVWLWVVGAPARDGTVTVTRIPGGVGIAFDRAF